MSRRDGTRDALDALHRVQQDPHALAAVDPLRQALGSRSAAVVAKAAAIIGDALLDGFTDALLRAWGRLFTRPVKQDPGCVAKLAIAEALDRLDHPDPVPFLRGAAHVQLEPAWGPPVDTAVGLRGRCGHALVRMAWPDALSVLADLFADSSPGCAPRPPGRWASTGPRARPHCCARLRQVQAAGGPPRGDGEVLDAVLQALRRTSTAGCPSWAPLRRAADLAESALFALSETRHDAALPALQAALDAAVLPADTERALTALAVHRTAASQQVLLAVLADGSDAHARQALQALAPQRFDGRLADRVRQAVAARPGPDRARAALLRVVAEVLGADGPGRAARPVARNQSTLMASRMVP